MKSFHAFLAQQLRLPSGWLGRLLLRFLNRKNALMNDLVLQALPLQSGDRVLEIGFGGGDLIAKLVNTKLPAVVVGVERSSDALAVCQQRFQPLIHRKTVELTQADAAALPFPDQTFNRIGTVNTLYFWQDAAQVLQECGRVLAPGGQLVIGYQAKTDLEQQGFFQHGFTAYDVAELEMMLKVAGFTQINTIAGTNNRQVFFCTSGIADPLLKP